MTLTRFEATKARQDGLDNSDLKWVATLGALGQCPQNVERDMHRRARHVLGITVTPYMVPLPDGLGQAALILPHEIFSDLWTHHPEQAMARTVGDHNMLLEFWRTNAQAAEEWYRLHPLRPVVEQRPGTCVPIRLWGDDAPVGKHGRACRVMSWSSPIVRLPGMQSKMAIYVVDPRAFKSTRAEDLDTLLR